jgi:hypothetical protein
MTVSEDMDMMQLEGDGKRNQRQFPDSSWALLPLRPNFVCCGHNFVSDNILLELA